MRIYAYLLAAMLATGDAFASDLFMCYDAAHAGGARFTRNPISVPESCHAWELMLAGYIPRWPGESVNRYARRLDARERQIRRDVRECNQYYESGACLFSKGYREGYE